MLKTITHYLKHFKNGPISFAKGMGVTLKNLFRRKVTLCYPEERPDIRPRFRGLHGLTKDPETGDLNCIGCLSCARICPDDLIGITLEKREGHQGRYPVEFTINVGPCCFCGLCSEVCPTPMKSLIMSSEFEIAPYCRDGQNLVLTKEKLIAIGEREVERRRGRKGQPEEKDNLYFTWADESAKAERMAKGAARAAEEKPPEGPPPEGKADQAADEKAARIAAARARAAARKAEQEAPPVEGEISPAPSPEEVKAARIAAARQAQQEGGQPADGASGQDD